MYKVIKGLVHRYCDYCHKYKNRFKGYNPDIEMAKCMDCHCEHEEKRMKDIIAMKNQKIEWYKFDFKCEFCGEYADDGQPWNKICHDCLG